MNRFLGSLVLTGWLTLLTGAGISHGPSDQARVGDGDQTFETKILPTISKYCIACHGGAKPKGGLTLESLRQAGDFQRNPELLETLLQRVRDAEMPPPGKPQPGKEERTALLNWAQRQLDLARASGKPNPGRVTLRRLNRSEYDNTIRDLTGVDFKPAEGFPSDDVGYGFDNIGDVLTLPPVLMEKYLAAAEVIVDQALRRRPTLSTSRSWQGNEFTPRAPGLLVGNDRQFRVLKDASEIRVTFDFPRGGEYEFQITGYNVGPGEAAPQVLLKMDGSPVKQFSTKGTEKKHESLKHRAGAKAGMHELSLALVDAARPEQGKKDSPKSSRQFILVRLDLKGPLEEVKHPILVVAPGPQLPPRSAARQILLRFAERAFRRPVKPEEVDRLMQLFDRAAARGDKFEEALKLPLQAVLVSPHFLFRVERDAGTAETRALDGFELASRLSYFLWSSMPDDALLDAARHGKLGSAQGLAAQAMRMLEDDRAWALVENFAGQWLQLRNLGGAAPDPKRFPAFDEPLRQAMQKETELFFAEMLHRPLPLTLFLDADFTFVNERLARHYGIPGVKGKAFRKVSLSSTPRRGILTHGSILTITSNPTRTSPVKRGKWVLETILGTPPPPPVPEAGDLKEGEEARGTLRQRMEQHRANPNCATCHNRMDPIGFGFENFDAIGAWRTRDGDLPIDSTGTLPSGQSFQSPGELVGLLKQRDDDFRRCLAEKMLTFALGRGLESSDRRYVADIAAATKAGGDTLAALIREVVKSEPFRFRSQRAGGP
jgi:mono/diheme cytochrome c family protein